MLPASLRSETGSFDLFKNHLDVFLSGVPDQPTMPGLARAAASNSLLDQFLLDDQVMVNSYSQQSHQLLDIFYRDSVTLAVALAKQTAQGGEDEEERDKKEEQGDKK